MTSLHLVSLIPSLFSVVVASGPDSVESRIEAIATELRSGKSTGAAVLIHPGHAELRERRAFRDLMREFPAPGEVVLASESEPGDRLIVEGVVKAVNGEPIAGALMYFYQTDATGVYSSSGGNATMGDSLNPRLFGYLKTGADGKYRITTIRPGAYPNDGPPAHIHVEIEAAGFRSRTTEIMMGDCPRLTDQARAWVRNEGFPVAELRRDEKNTLRGTADFRLGRSVG